MLRANLVNVFGVFLVLLGLFGPWFTYHLPQRLGNSPFANAMAHISVSPFVFSNTLTSTSNSSVYEDIEVLSQYSVHFYSAHSSIVGLACIIGAAVGFAGGYARRPKVTVMSGFLSLVATLFFFFLLPSYVIYVGISCYPTWGFWLSLTGSLAVILSNKVEFPTLDWAIGG
jgi:hypothetical protein